MKMSGEIRVSTDKRYRSIYKEVKNFAVGDMHEFFTLCACTGYKNKKKIPLGTNKEDRFWSRTFSTDEYASFYAIALNETIESNNLDFSILQDDGKVISLMEEYANGGIQVIIDDFLENYLVKSDSDPRLDIVNSKELPRKFLNFIWEQLSNSNN